MKSKKIYPGIHNDGNGGMTPIAKTIRDAWVFELISEDETCENWDLNRIGALLAQVNAEWDKYGCMVSKLPEALAERHYKIHDAAIKKAKTSGWDADKEVSDES